MRTIGHENAISEARYYKEEASRIFKNVDRVRTSNGIPILTEPAYGPPVFRSSGVESLFVVEGKYLLYVLTYTGWHVQRTADLMGRSKKWVRDRIDTHQLKEP